MPFVACGLTHLAAVLAIWTPAWQLTGAIKYATAAASVATAVALPPLVPRVVALAAEARSAEERRRQLVSANRERDEAEARFRGAFGDAPIGMALVGPEGGFLHVNNALCELVGYDQGDLLTKSFQDITHPDDLRADLEHACRVLAGEIRSYQMEKRYVHRRGHAVWIQLNVSLMRADDGTPRYFIAQMQDITERRALEVQLRDLAHHDPLTGLLNRAAFAERLDTSLALAGPDRVPVGVLFVDLDGFKLVNDGHGHAAGDQVLVEVAGRLAACLRTTDAVARVGGDEFAVVLEPLPGGTVEAATLADRILAALAEPLRVGGQEAFVSASIGIAVAESGSAGADDLLRDADAAHYRAKANGKGCYVVAPADGALRPDRRIDLASDLHRAIERGDIQLCYQPQVDLATNRMVAVEALARWTHPIRGPIPPAEFIPLAEETGLIVPLGQAVLTEACRQARRWQDEYGAPGDFVVSVNVSGWQLRRPDIVETVATALGDSGLNPDRLELELAEGVLVRELGSGGEALRTLRGIGVSLAIDDFGSGYSALDYLRRFTVDALKVDRSLINSESDNPDQAILGAVAALGGALGLRVTAEGVESAAQLAMVRAAGCHRVQGYHIARPMTEEEIGELLKGLPLAYSDGSVESGVGTAGICLLPASFRSVGPFHQENPWSPTTRQELDRASPTLLADATLLI